MPTGRWLYTYAVTSGPLSARLFIIVARRFGVSAAIMKACSPRMSYVISAVSFVVFW